MDNTAPNNQILCHGLDKIVRIGQVIVCFCIRFPTVETLREEGCHFKISNISCKYEYHVHEIKH